MLDKHQQNLDTFKEYLKEHDLSIRLNDFVPKYSLDTLLEAMLRAVREYLTKSLKYKFAGSIKAWPRGALANIEKNKGLGV